MNKLFSVSIGLVLLFTFSHCSDDEPSSVFSYSVNGTAEKPGTVTAVLRFETQYEHEGRVLFISAFTGSTKALSVAVANWDFQNPPANGILTGAYDATWDFENTTSPNPHAGCLELSGDFSGEVLCPGGLVTYIVDETDLYFSTYGDDPEGTVTITSCNTSSRTVSGTFLAKVRSFDEEELNIEGSFQNVKYIVVQ